MQGTVGHSDDQVLRRLRRGDEAAFAELVVGWSPAMLRLARGHVPSRAVAEEVVQETWLAVLRGLDAFEGRSSLRTWVFQILLNRARTRGQRERRTIPFAVLAAPDPPADAAGDDPERRAQDAETAAVLRHAIAGLPDKQRVVITLRDVEGWPAREVCDVLGISAGNQRILLHRARVKAREALEGHLAPWPVGQAA